MVRTLDGEAASPLDVRVRAWIAGGDASRAPPRRHRGAAPTRPRVPRVPGRRRRQRRRCRRGLRRDERAALALASDLRVALLAANLDVRDPPPRGGGLPPGAR